MNPLNSKSNRQFTSTTRLIKWDGPNIECLGLCKGMDVGEVVYAVGKLVCTLKDELDLSDLDLKGIIQKCKTCPDPVITLKTVFELLIEKTLSLEDIVSKLSPGGSVAQQNLTVASCFVTTNAQGDKVTTLEHSTYTRRIGVKMCEVVIQMSEIADQITNLESEISDLALKVRTLENNSGSLSTLQQKIDDLRSEFNNLIRVVGTTTDLAGSFTEEISGAGPQNAVMSLADRTQALWTGGSKSVAETITRIWLALSDVRTAVKIIQDNCCQIDCDDIIIDFDVRMSDDRNTMTLFFAYKSKLPNGFVDAKVLGNTLNISDVQGRIYNTKIKLSDAIADIDGVTVDLTLSPLDVTGDLYLSMDAAVKSDSLQCVKCISKTVAPKQSANCGFCVIKSVGINGPGGIGIVVYELEGVTYFKTLRVGEEIIISSKAVIKSTAVSDMALQSECFVLPQPKTLACYNVDWTTDIQDAGGTDPWDDADVRYTGISFLGKYYKFNTQLEGGDVSQIDDEILKLFPSLFIDCTNVNVPEVGSQRRRRLVFATSEDIGKSFFLHFTVAGYNEVTIKAEPCADCCPSLNTTQYV